MFCKCGRKARISRPHEGRAYCEQCLIRLVRRRVKRELRKLGIEKGDKVVIFVPRCSRFHALLLEELEKIFAKWKELRLIALIFDFEEKTSTEPKIGKIEMKRLRIPSQPKSCQECINTQLEICKKFLGDNEAKIMTSLVLEEILTLFLRTFLEGTPIFLWSPLGFLRGREARICSEFLKLTPRNECEMKDELTKTLDRMLEDLETKHPGVLNQLYTSAKVIGKDPYRLKD